MKRNNVLLGLFVGMMVLAIGAPQAQIKANYRSGLTEVGPMNLGGRVRTVVVDQADPTQRTLFAGAASGGLYVRTADTSRLNRIYNTLGVDGVPADTNSWHFIPMYEANGSQLTLPITSMVQVSDSVIVIATGESYYPRGTRHTAFTPVGRGMFRFNTNTLRFTRIAGTEPDSPNHNFSSINNLDYMYRNGALYLFAATTKGLFRWKIENEGDWNNRTQLSTESIDQVMVIRSRNMALFTSGNKLYRIGNIENASQAVDISSSNAAFGGTNSRIYLAVAPSDNNYIYAMVTNRNGLFENVYLTTNQQTWRPLATSSVTPFSVTNSSTCGAIYVDPGNPKKIYLGGSSVWIGEGYTDDGYYQWSRTSYNEYELNGGDFMGNVFSTAIYVHSGINYIVSGYQPERSRTVYYIATNGGIFMSDNNCEYFSNISRGMNAIQVNGLAVSPDGSLTIGANQYAVPFIEARMAHSAGDTNITWYDNGELGNMNHLGNVLWYADGGQTAASMFQQVKPIARRTIFTSTYGGGYGRAYDDYSNYGNTQTWTIGEPFLSNAVNGGPEIGIMALWETLNDSIYNDSIIAVFDTLGVIYRGDEVIDFGANIEKKPADRDPNLYMANFQIQAGDRVRISSPAHAGYPFEYEFPTSVSMTQFLKDTVSWHGFKYVGAIKAKNPIQSRMFVVANSTTNMGGVANTSVMMTWMPTDFRKTYSAEASTAEDAEEMMRWSTVYSARHANNEFVRAIAVSNDGLSLYVAVVNTVTNSSYIARVSNFDAVDYSLPNDEIDLQLGNGNRRRLVTDTVIANAATGDIWFPRTISSIVVNPREGTDELVVTFEGFNNNYANVALVTNASVDTLRAVSQKALPEADMPAYSAMVEYTTGDVYVGTEFGVFKSLAANFATTPVWNTYGEFNGVPVTAMVQQTKALPVVHFVGHTGITADSMVFAKTKWPYAMYFGTYGRGVFMDMTYVTDSVNEITDPEDYLAIPRVSNVGDNRIAIYPNPAVDNATVDIDLSAAGNAVIVVYDLAGRRVITDNLGRMSEGEHTYRLDCSKLAPGMYLVNLKVGNNTSAAKMIVK